MSTVNRSMFLVPFVALVCLLGPDNSSAQQRLRPTIDLRPNLRPTQDWQLGVHADDTRTGMLITSVVRGSAADRAGLVRGDRILTVGTERVGLIGFQAVPMRKVLRRQADFQGEVVLLVKRQRTRGLANLTVRLDRVGGSQIFTN
jgi:predicted metalloprotease with PDZ domain